MKKLEEEDIMKKWNTPSITELNINETANGYFKVGYEGPFDIVFGDRNENKPVAPDPDTNAHS